MNAKSRAYGKALVSGGSATIAMFAVMAVVVASPLLLRSLGIAATTGSTTVVVNSIINGADIALTLVAIFGITTGAATFAAIGVKAILKLATTNAAKKAAIPAIAK